MTYRDNQPQETARSLKPGDQAALGTPGTGEALCPVCGGKGSVDNKPCVECAGTGVVVQGIGGA